MKVLWVGQQPLLKQCNSKENQWCTVLLLQTRLPKRLLMDSGVRAPPSCGVGFGETNGEEGTHHHESIMKVMGSSAHDTRFL